MKYKKVFAVALTAAVAVSLAACGSGSDTGSAKDNGSSSSVAGSTDGSQSAGESTSGAASEGNESAGAGTENGTLTKATDPSKLPAAAKERTDTLVAGTADFQGVFNPLYSESTEDQRISMLISAPLLNNDDEGKLIDGTASMTISDDGLTYTFKISDKDKFSDGTPTTAADYANFFKILDDKSYDGYGDFSLDKIVGWDDYKTNGAADIEGVKALDDKTLEIKIEKPNFTAKYDFGAAIPISTKVYGSLLTKGDLSKFKAVDMTTWVGNGAYTLSDVKEKSSVTLQAANTFYLGEPKIPKIIFKVVATNSELQALEAGDVDIDEDVVCDQDFIDEATSDGFVNQWIEPNLGYGYISLNHNKDAFKDQKVRQALLYALDRQSVVSAVYGTYAQVLNIPQSKVSWAYDDTGVNTYDYNLDKAQELLKEAGWVKQGDKLMKDGKQMKIIMSAMPDNPVTMAMIPVMIDSYGKLGIDFQAEYVDWPTLVSKSQSLNYDMIFQAWGLLPNPDASIVYASPDKGGGQNHYAYSNPEMDQMFVDARAAKTDDEFKADYAKIYKLWNEDLPVLPVYQRSNLICFNTRVQGFAQSPYCKWYVPNKIINMSLAN